MPPSVSDPLNCTEGSGYYPHLIKEGIGKPRAPNHEAQWTVWPHTQQTPEKRRDRHKDLPHAFLQMPGPEMAGVWLGGSDRVVMMVVLHVCEWEEDWLASSNIELS